MTKLGVRLLGGFQVEREGEPVPDFATDKTRALLAYLIVEAERPLRREALAGLLWPDRPDSVARTNLRQALARLRRALGDYGSPPFLFTTATDVQFNSAADYTLDVAELEAFAHSPDRYRRLLPPAFCGDFLEGFATPDSPVFEEWVLNRQEHYHRLAIETLDVQNAYFEENGEYDQAAAAARLQLEIEPWLEEAHRRCMRALALAGRRDEALHQYDVCRRALAAELGVEPAAATQALYDDIRSEQVVAPAHQAPPSRVQAQQAAAAVGLVAREDELDRLSRHLDAALAGQPQIVFVSGDPGSGKTVLLEAFAAAASADHADLLVAGVRCSPGGSLDPYAPLHKLMEKLCGDLSTQVGWHLALVQQDERLLRATNLIHAALTEYGPAMVGTLVTVQSLARRAGHASPASATAAANWQRTAEGSAVQQMPVAQEVLFDQLLSTLAAIAQHRPLLLLFDDLQWVDDATATFLLRIGRELDSSRLLLVGAYRSTSVALGRRSPLGEESGRHPMAAVVNELRRIHGDIVTELDRTDGRAFIESYVDLRPNRLGAPFRDALYAQTGGHALFTVELLRNLEERGMLVRDQAGRWTVHKPLDWDPLPARVEAAIAERIERLPADCRRLLACASVQGDDFSGEAVAELAGAQLCDVLNCLSGPLARQHQLVQPLGVQRQGNEQYSLYRFAHHLFQKYLYEQLDAVERTQLHAAFAAILDRRLGSELAERGRLSTQLAWQYASGGLPLPAARALHDAGRQAMRVSAYREALSHFDHALALLATTPLSPERAEIEQLVLVAALGPWRNAEGLASDRLAQMLARAEQATSQAPARLRLMLLEAKAEQLWARGQLTEGLAVAQQMLEQATEWEDDAFIIVAHWQFGFIYNLMGRPQQSETHFTQVLSWLTPERQSELRAAIGTDLATMALVFSSLNWWWLGRSDQVLARLHAAITGAHDLGDTYEEAEACALCATVLFLLRSDPAALQERSERCHRLCLQHGYSMWRVFAEVFLGRVAVMQAQDAAAVEAGIEQMRNAIAVWQRSNMVIGNDILALVLADGCLAAAEPCRLWAIGLPDRLLALGLDTVDTVLGPAGRPCGQSYAAELHRMRGELLLARDALAAAEKALDCFLAARHIAHAQGALAWELRVALSILRLRQRLGTVAELTAARQELCDLYARFTEGFQYPDLRDAAALIAATA